MISDRNQVSIVVRRFDNSNGCASQWQKCWAGGQLVYAVSHPDLLRSYTMFDMILLTQSNIHPVI
jgi:hypothetical protein